LDRELEIAGRTTNSFTESLRIFSQRVAGGTASALEASRAEAALADAAAAIPAILDEISSTENALSLLLGHPPGPIERSSASLQSLLPPEVPAGLPSSLLVRRPDVREAEQLVRSANAQVGESVADFFPKIGLTALLGKVSPELSAFTLGSANAWSIAAEASGPLFEGGRLVGQYRQTKAARDEASLHYRQTALAALRDVSDALTSRERLAEVREQRVRQVTALETAVKLSSERYVAGKASYYEVLEAQQQLFPAELNLARTERDPHGGRHADRGSAADDHVLDRGGDFPVVAVDSVDLAGRQQALIDHDHAPVRPFDRPHRHPRASIPESPTRRQRCGRSDRVTFLTRLRVPRYRPRA